MFGLGDGDWAPIYDAFGNPFLLETQQGLASRSWAQDGMLSYVRWFEHTVVFRPYFYLIIAIAAAIALRRARASVGVVSLVLGSAAAYEATLVVAAPAADFRLSHYLVVASTAAAVVCVLAQFARLRREEAAS
jgi:hypothetical protein